MARGEARRPRDLGRVHPSPRDPRSGRRRDREGHLSLVQRASEVRPFEEVGALQASRCQRALARQRHLLAWWGRSDVRCDPPGDRSALSKVPEGGWRYSDPAEMQRQIKLGLVEFREDHTEPPFRKAHLRPVAEESPDVADDEADDVARTKLNSLRRFAAPTSKAVAGCGEAPSRTHGREGLQQPEGSRRAGAALRVRARRQGRHRHGLLRGLGNHGRSRVRGLRARA